jgi:hypothetical protein
MGSPATLLDEHFVVREYTLKPLHSHQQRDTRVDMESGGPMLFVHRDIERDRLAECHEESRRFWKPRNGNPRRGPDIVSRTKLEPQ